MYKKLTGLGSYSFGESCYKTHKPLPIRVGDKTYYVHGGSCLDPAITDADVYVGFDHGMSPMPFKGVDLLPENIYFDIPDMSVPSNAVLFKKLVQLIAKKLKADLKVHVGCIGGHGRTGTFLAALVADMTGDKDAISYVRKGYCSSAVETTAQERYLAKHFGCEIPSGSFSEHGFHQPTLIPPVDMSKAFTIDPEAIPQHLMIL
ncbi:MAG: hypothetical protein RRY07_00890 [Bacteroidaceae bacterium]